MIASQFKTNLLIEPIGIDAGRVVLSWIPLGAFTGIHRYFIKE